MLMEAELRNRIHFGPCCTDAACRHFLPISRCGPSLCMVALTIRHPELPSFPCDLRSIVDLRSYLLLSTVEPPLILKVCVRSLDVGSWRLFHTILSFIETLTLRVKSSFSPCFDLATEYSYIGTWEDPD